MSRICLPTRHLVGLLADTLPAACKDQTIPTLCSIVLHTDHGPYALPTDDHDGDRSTGLIDEVDTDLLVATATDRTLLVQAHTWCEGQLGHPLLLSVVDADAVIDLFKPLISSLGRDTVHRVIVEQNRPRALLTIREDPTQVPDGKALIVVARPADDYPRNVSTLMQPDTTATVSVLREGLRVIVEPSYGTGVQATHLAIMAKVAKNRGMPLALYRHHQDRILVGTVGTSWRCAAQPARLSEDAGEYKEPPVPVFDLPLPPRGLDGELVKITEDFEVQIHHAAGVPDGE